MNVLRRFPKAVLILVPLMGLGGVVFLNSKMPKPIGMETKGKFQSGSEYEISGKLIPADRFSFGNARYQITSLNLVVDGKTRAVPTTALQDVADLDPAQKLALTEEGPVWVVSAMAGDPKHAVQWRFLNGFFAQRRILGGAEIAIQNAEVTLKAPTMVSNVSSEAPRRLGAPNLLPTTDEKSPEPLKK